MHFVHAGSAEHWRSSAGRGLSCVLGLCMVRGRQGCFQCEEVCAESGAYQMIHAVC